MPSTANLNSSVNLDETKASESPVVWGCDEIGRVIGRNSRQTNHLLAKNQIKSAKKVGGKWVASRAALLREFGHV